MYLRTENSSEASLMGVVAIQAEIIDVAMLKEVIRIMMRMERSKHQQDAPYKQVIVNGYWFIRVEWKAFPLSILLQDISTQRGKLCQGFEIVLLRYRIFLCFCSVVALQKSQVVVLSRGIFRYHCFYKRVFH